MRAWLLGVVCCVACARPPAAPRPSGGADFTLQGVTIRSYTQSQLRVVTTADSLEAFREVGTPGDLIAHDAGVLLVRDGTRLRADLVTGNFLVGRLEGRGRVELEGRGGLKARTEFVLLDRSEGAGGVASSDAGLVLQQPGLTLTAQGFVADLAEEHIDFEQAKTEFSPR